jgi:hypothetical protein
MSPSRRPPVWLWFVATPIVLVALAWGALVVLLPPARATQLVREQLAKSLAREVRFDGVRLSNWPSRGASSAGRRSPALRSTSTSTCWRCCRSA